MAKKTLNKILETTKDKFGGYVSDLGYTAYWFEMLPAPRMSNRGLLRARGGFVGPNPYTDDRPVEDECEFSFFVLEDENYENLLMLEVKLGGAMLATFKITSEGIFTYTGELPHA